jgi:hypothetical protein
MPMIGGHVFSEEPGLLTNIGFHSEMAILPDFFRQIEIANFSSN